MMEILAYPFMQRALAAGILVGFLGSYYGVFIVQRKMSFLGDGLAHAAFGGVALGMLLNIEPLWIAVPFTVLVSLCITWLKQKTDLENDTTIGILFAVSVALGIIFISLKKDYAVDAFSYLFGSILSVGLSDLLVTCFVALISCLTFFRLWGRWAYATFDSELAESDGLNVDKDNYILSVLTAVAIVVSIKLVGIVLIAAFIVIPPASSRLVSNTFSKMTILAVIFGLLSSVVGMILSLLLDLPSGAVIILTQALIFIIALTYSKLRTS
jgi:zinc transport system permease protein